MRCEKDYQSLICEGIKILSIQWQESIILTTLWLDVGMSVGGIQHFTCKDTRWSCPRAGSVTKKQACLGRFSKVDRGVASNQSHIGSSDPLLPEQPCRIYQLFNIRALRNQPFSEAARLLIYRRFPYVAASAGFKLA